MRRAVRKAREVSAKLTFLLDERLQAGREIGVHAFNRLVYRKAEMLVESVTRDREWRRQREEAIVENDVCVTGHGLEPKPVTIVGEKHLGPHELFLDNAPLSAVVGAVATFHAIGIEGTALFVEDQDVDADRPLAIAIRQPRAKQGLDPLGDPDLAEGVVR